MIAPGYSLLEYRFMQITSADKTLDGIVLDRVSLSLGFLCVPPKQFIIKYYPHLQHAHVFMGLLKFSFAIKRRSLIISPPSSSARVSHRRHHHHQHEACLYRYAEECNEWVE